MDRSLITPYRAEEKELSNLLYSKLMGLTLIYPPNEEMTRILTDEMFLKPNQTAFFQIMAYLFRLLDPIEFRKRFYWPITDKRAESNFRSSTVEYLKFLNEKHQLNWSGIKSYLVVMPGGMKFINFMLDLTNFVTKELIKQKEKHLSLDANSLRNQMTATSNSFQIVIDRNNFLKKYASAYLNTINEVIDKTKAKIDILTKQLNATTLETNIPIDIFISDTFIHKFHDDTYALYKKQLNHRCNKLLLIEQALIELKNIMDHFSSQADTYKCNNSQIFQFLNYFHIHIPQMEGKSDRTININTLIYIYNRLHDFIQNELSTSSKLPLANHDFIINLLNIKEELQQMEIEINNLQKTVNTNIKKRVNMPACTPLRGDIAESNTNLENSLLMKFIATPPIKLGMSEDNCQKRLSLMDTKPQRNNELSRSFLAPTQSIRNIRTINEYEREKSIHNSTNHPIRTTVINPSELLKTIGKQPFKYKTLTEPTSGISIKLQPRGGTPFDVGDENKSPKTSYRRPCSPKRLPLSCDIKMTSQFVSTSQSPFTPLHSNDCTRIIRHRLNTSDSGDNASCVNSIKKLSAVKKIQFATKDPVNLNTSPSGRLTALFADDANKITPNLATPSTELEFETDENNPSAANVAKESTKWKILEQNLRNEQNEEEMLLNISDSVLNDVII